MKKLPKALQNFIAKKGVHWVIQFQEDYWFTPLKNSLYKLNDELLFAETNQPICLGDMRWKLEILNPKTQEYSYVYFDEQNWYTRHNAYDEKNYLRGLEAYVGIDYDAWENCYALNISKYLQDKYSHEITLKPDGWFDITLSISDVIKKLKCLKEYRSNQVSDWDTKCKGKEMAFFDFQSLYSFVQELDTEMKGLHIGNEYSELYDKVVSGNVSKEEFLKVIIK